MKCSFPNGDIARQDVRRATWTLPKKREIRNFKTGRGAFPLFPSSFTLRPQFKLVQELRGITEGQQVVTFHLELAATMLGPDFVSGIERRHFRPDDTTTKTHAFVLRTATTDQLLLLPSHLSGSSSVWHAGALRSSRGLSCASSSLY